MMRSITPGCIPHPAKSSGTRWSRSSPRRLACLRPIEGRLDQANLTARTAIEPAIGFRDGLLRRKVIVPTVMTIGRLCAIVSLTPGKASDLIIDPDVLASAPGRLTRLNANREGA